MSREQMHAVPLEAAPPLQLPGLHPQTHAAARRLSVSATMGAVCPTCYGAMEQTTAGMALTRSSATVSRTARLGLRTPQPLPHPYLAELWAPGPKGSDSGHSMMGFGPGALAPMGRTWPDGTGWALFQRQPAVWASSAAGTAPASGTPVAATSLWTVRMPQTR